MSKKNEEERQPVAAEISESMQELESFKEPMALGSVFIKSGMFPDVKTQSQAVVKILAGKEIGLSPFESMGGIYFVNNKLALLANVMASLVKRSKRYDYSIEKLDDQECIVVIYGKEGDKKVELGKSSFTFKDAAKAGLVNKDNWKNYPRNMLFSRALSNGVRWFAPDALCGYYVTDELEDVNTEPKKDVIEITPEGKVENGTP